MTGRGQSRRLLPAWQQLEESLQPRWSRRHLREAWAEETADRAGRLSRRWDGLLMDFSKQRLDDEVLAALFQLARECGLAGAIAHLLGGSRVNETEGRAALHSALRLPREATLVVDGRDVVPDVHASLARMRDIVQRIHARQWRGVTGRAITDVVSIGVGGSDLGPFLVTNALGEFAPEAAQGLNLHFVSSIDGTQIADLLDTLRPETTLFIVASKSFTTIDTLSNAETALTWMLGRIPDRERVLRHHVIGVSANPLKMSEYGIPEPNQIAFWDFSLWSAIGLPIALKLGMAGFEQLLAGAHAVDRHFGEAALEDNLPVIMGLLMVWNSTFLGINAQAILPYDARLKLFPAYLTQLEMESNGKSVDRQGQPLGYDTCPVLWGDVGSNAQHAFYQLLHQGTQAVACDFIAPILRYDRDDQAGGALQVQHQLSLSNCFAQSRVLMLGDACLGEDDRAAATGAGHKHYRGNQPSTTLLLDELTPYSLGQLIALYEHKVYVASVIWNINPFDQWGVELGKKIAGTTYTALQKGGDLQAFDPSTRQLLQAVRS
ncbi:MAG: glucose-6-phosphate isomerase [Perlucidibaca sp.]